MVSLWKIAGGLAMAAGMGLAAVSAPGVARPGTVNYAEGVVTVAGQTVGAQEIGRTEVAVGQVLETQAGKAELLLTPGVLLRVNDQSAVRMLAGSLTDTRIELLRGEAMVEAQQVLDENRIAVTDRGVETLIAKKGIYRFEADPALVSVYDGKVKVLADDRTIEIGKGKQLALGVDTKPRKFDRDQTDSLYAWSKVRSSYLAEANEASAQTIVVGSPGWYGSGWYWNSGFRTWAFLPGSGYLMSPFGFGFYSPSYYWYAPRPVFRSPYRGYPSPGSRGWHGPREGRAPMHVPPSSRPGAGGRTLGRGARM